MKSETSIQTIDELQRFLGEILDDTQSRIAAVLNRYKVSYTAFTEYLEVNYPDLADGISRLQQNIDGDIFRKISDGMVGEKELNDWKENLRKWRHLLIEGIAGFEEYQTLSCVA